MGNDQMPALRYADDAATRDRRDAVIEFVGGPRDGQREPAVDTPDSIASQGGAYRRSVRCADDGALRYVFDEDPTAIAHERMIRPC
jgi:hypothetical protein